MSLKHKYKNPEGIYFTTFTDIGWIDIFTREVYRDISNWCQLCGIINNESNHCYTHKIIKEK